MKLPPLRRARHRDRDGCYIPGSVDSWRAGAPNRHPMNVAIPCLPLAIACQKLKATGSRPMSMSFQKPHGYSKAVPPTLLQTLASKRSGSVVSRGAGVPHNHPNRARIPCLHLALAQRAGRESRCLMPSYGLRKSTKSSKRM